jgi:hypothetical protein
VEDSYEAEDGYMEEEPFYGTITLAELSDTDKEDMYAPIYEAIDEFILYTGYIPEKKHKQKMIEALCSETYIEDGKQLLPDEGLTLFFDEILQSVIGDFREEGIDVESYLDTLVVSETERLTIRKFIRDDLPSLHAIMEKEEVMYAWYIFGRKPSSGRMPVSSYILSRPCHHICPHLPSCIKHLSCNEDKLCRL